ncbi:MAG TPA: hypothetical protein VK450_04430, partial [Methanomicrobiales archaeon]|nr:hypothetical protein [Methanomicrobiales archaeon]
CIPATFISQRRFNPSPMQRLTASERLPGGITVYYAMGDEEMETSFSFMELIDRRINSLDLIENPRKYQYDEDSGALILKP